LLATLQPWKPPVVGRPGYFAIFQLTMIGFRVGVRAINIYDFAIVSDDA